MTRVDLLRRLTKPTAANDCRPKGYARQSIRQRSLGRRRVGATPRRLFPRSKDRGLIEARAPATRMLVIAAFPRSKDRGLIEASIRRLIPPETCLFPRSKDRGLIEAVMKG